jgi:hypothetical protein
MTGGHVVGEAPNPIDLSSDDDTLRVDLGFIAILVNFNVSADVDICVID